MKLATGWNWLASVAVVFAVLAIGIAGCSSPQDKEKSKSKTSAKSGVKTTPKSSAKTESKTDAVTAVKTEEPAKTEEPKKTEEAKTEEPKKTEEAKTEEPKKTEEAKTEEPKKTEEAKTEEPKVEEPKKTEEPMKTEEPKVEEPKKTEEPMKTEEPKVEEPKKTEEAKTEEPKAEEPKKTEEPAKEAAAPAAPAANVPVKASAYAPAEDLDGQMDDYLKSLVKTVETEQTFKDESGNLVKDANTMAVLALVIGLHDQESKYKAAAPALLKASQALAEVKDYEAAKKAAAGVVAALDSKEPAALKWEKVAALPELMKQVPNVHTKLKMKITGTRLKSQAKATQGYTAVIAAIGQASIVDTSEAKTPEDVQKWQAYCVDMRDAAAAVNAAIRKQDRAAVDDTMVKLQKSCDDCHKVFHQAALSK